MTRTAKQSVGLFLAVAIVGVLAWRLWPDGGRARRQQRDRELLYTVSLNRLADATRLLDEGANPNTETQPLSVPNKLGLFYFYAAHKLKPPPWGQMDGLKPRRSVLELAVFRGNLDMVRVLMAKGADAGYVDSEGWTPFGWSEAMKEGPISAALLKAPAAQPRPVRHP